MVAPMNEEWRNRLRHVLERDGRSKRSVSLAAGCGPGYLHSVLDEGKDPTVERLLRVCQELNISMAWLLYGVNISPDTQDLIKIIEGADPADREGILRLLRARAL